MKKFIILQEGSIINSMAKDTDTDIVIISNDDIKSRIYTIRGMQVMLDSDLAEIYGYETKTLNQQVKGNIEKFPLDFMFRLTEQDVDKLLRSQNVITMQKVIFLASHTD